MIKFPIGILAPSFVTPSTGVLGQTGPTITAAALTTSGSNAVMAGDVLTLTLTTSGPVITSEDSTVEIYFDKNTSKSMTYNAGASSSTSLVFCYAVQSTDNLSDGGAPEWSPYVAYNGGTTVKWNGQNWTRGGSSIGQVWVPCVGMGGGPGSSNPWSSGGMGVITFGALSGTIQDASDANLVPDFTAPDTTGWTVNLAPAWNSGPWFTFNGTNYGSYAGAQHLTTDMVVVLYTAGTTLPITVSGAPYVPITIGGNVQHMAYNASLSDNGSGNGLAFQYTVQAGDVATASNISVAAMIDDNGGTILGASGLAIPNTLPALDSSVILWSCN